LAKSAEQRLAEAADSWAVAISSRADTEGSLIAFGTRACEPVVLKVVRAYGDEWRCGEVLSALAGKGMVRCLAHAPGAALMERLEPGTSLAMLSECGRDEEATIALGDAIAAMSVVDGAGFPTVREWGRSFETFDPGACAALRSAMVTKARDLHFALCDTQRDVRLLHGDLHHYNVLRDTSRGWMVIDPKGVVGELEYEVGAMLRNPRGHPALQDSVVALRRIELVCSRLELNEQRALAWAFTQAVLSALWTIEDHGEVASNDPAVVLAECLESQVSARVPTRPRP
jgi:streptomycin 6-kinase